MHATLETGVLVVYRSRLETDMGRHQGMLMDRMIWRRLLIIVIESEQLFSMD